MPPGLELLQELSLITDASAKGAAPLEDRLVVSDYNKHTLTVRFSSPVFTRMS